MSATTAITISSENPTSNTMVERVDGRARPRVRESGRRPSGLRLVLDFAFDGAAAQLRWCGGSVVAVLVGRRVLHPVLEPAHRTAEVGADIAELLRAEDEQDDQQHDQPVQIG